MELGQYPDYPNPPVVETVLGVDFSPLENWKTPYFGLFWERLKPDFDEVEDQLPLESEIESLDRIAKPILPRLQLLSKPLVRCWFIDRRRSVLLQVQNGRFIQNWRKETGTHQYPHFESTRQAFERDWKRFLTFLDEMGLGVPSVRQCELSYINHLEAGKGWESLADVGGVIPALELLAGEELPVPEAFLVNVRYLLPDRRGRLHLQVHPAIRDADGKDILVFALTTRGNPYSSDVEDILGWFDFGREWIHKAFRGFAAPRMREIWGRKKEIE